MTGLGLFLVIVACIWAMNSNSNGWRDP